MLTIKKLIFNIVTNLSSNNIDFVDENTIFEKTTVNIEIGNEEIVNNITKKKISIKSPLNTEGVLEKVKNNIYYALFYYWNTPNNPNNIGLIVFLLNPYYKELDFVKLKDEKIK